MARGPPDRRDRLQRSHVGHHRDDAPRAQVRTDGRAFRARHRDEFLAVVERTRRRADEVPAASSGSPPSPTPTACRSSRTTTPARSSGAGIARSAAIWRNSRPRWRRPRTPPRRATTSCSALPDVVRGGSHTGWIDDATNDRAGLVGARLASTTTPAAARGFRAGGARHPAARAGVAVVVREPRRRATGRPRWNRRRPARGPDHRGRIARRQPRIVATIVAGRIVHLPRNGYHRRVTAAWFASNQRHRGPMDAPRYAIYFCAAGHS